MGLANKCTPMAVYAIYASESINYATLFNIKKLHDSQKSSTFAYMEKDLKDIEIERLKKAVVGLINENVSLKKDVRFYKEEAECIEKETREECEAKYRLKIESLEEKIRDCQQLLEAKDKELAEAKAKADDLDDVRKAADAAKLANIDLLHVIDVINRRTFGRNSDATRLLNGEIDPNDPMLQELGFEETYKCVMAMTADTASGKKHTQEPETKERAPKLPTPIKEEKKDLVFTDRRRKYTATELRSIGLDLGDLPANAKIVRRKSKEGGRDTWFVQLFEYVDPKVIKTEYEIARLSVPGEGMTNSKYPESIIKGNPVMPSFARFYFDSKFALNLSENRILEMLDSMKTKIPQSTLNNWMHQIMEHLRTNLEHLMLEAIRQSRFTHNDETRILVRSRADRNAPFKYKREYIHAALSLEKKLVVMLYKDGSRDHSIQEEYIFKDSGIRCFLADRAPLYETIVKDLEEFHIERAACWFHLRHYLVDAYIVDSRVLVLIQLINMLFYIERESAKRKQTCEQRLRFRLKYSRPIVRKILKRLEAIRKAGNEYGQMVHRAVNYILDDKEAFLKFLQDGQVEMHNNAIERMFRHIAIGRRNWLHTGSHFAAENIAFMYSLLESCKMNDINFGMYIEDILTRMMQGETPDATFLPNNFIPRPAKQTSVA